LHTRHMDGFQRLSVSVHSLLPSFLGHHEGGRPGYFVSYHRHYTELGSRGQKWGVCLQTFSGSAPPPLGLNRDLNRSLDLNPAFSVAQILMTIAIRIKITFRITIRIRTPA
jgi:hypothetical protein